MMTKERGVSERPPITAKLPLLLLFAAGAFLLFSIQPIVGKLLLPKLGGGPNVWTACLLFFQSGLLFGYLASFLLIAYVNLFWQRTLFLIFLLSSVVIVTSTTIDIAPDAALDSIGSIALELCRTIGLPYVILSCTSPLLATWTEQSGTHQNNYRWYIASNLGSFVACLTYPLVIEPASSLSAQLAVWKFAYSLFAFVFAWLAAAQAITIIRSHRAGSLSLGASAKTFPFNTTTNRMDAVAPSELITWILFSACSSIVLAASTSRICQIGAIVPLLWIVPLSIYLASWSIAFGLPSLGSFRFAIPAFFVAGVLACILMFFRLNISYRVQLLGYSVVVGLVSLVCHGQLYDSRPAPSRLSQFYLAIALGGVVGSVFTAFVAPAVLSDYYELHIGLGLGSVLIAGRFVRIRWQAIMSDDRVRLVKFPAALLMPCFLITLLIAHATFQGNEVVVRKLRDRFGVVCVIEKPKEGLLAMLHGGTEHGLQTLSGELSTESTLYYRSDSGVSLAITWLREQLQRPLSVGVIGLGTGALSLYSREHDRFVYYEISEAVRTIASENFRYLDSHRGSFSIRMGDGRALLSRELIETPKQFDLLVADAFTNDSIPMHLLTVEALSLYQASVSDSGLIAIHITNRNLDLAPILEASAFELGMRSFLVETAPSIRWLILIPSNSTAPDPWPTSVSRPALRTQGIRWTDDYGSIIQAIK